MTIKIGEVTIDVYSLNADDTGPVHILFKYGENTLSITADLFNMKLVDVVKKDFIGYTPTGDKSPQRRHLEEIIGCFANLLYGLP